ncbi:molybdopterin dinucleotide binding domain-containing protein [Actinomadura yumaensis]|uniref:molybdopterin dinucleotide binding domain-containing protein n=1 Tax=Actinomadura yumaensis TaxID=111807 RepID=UPI0036088D79
MLIGRRHLRSNNSWLHNVPELVRGSNTCTLHLNPSDADRLGIGPGDTVRVVSRTGSVEATAEPTDAVMAGVVSLPHGWGHDRPGTRTGTASRHAGVNVNVLTDEREIDPLSGTAVFNGVPVTLEPVPTSPTALPHQRTAAPARSPQPAEPTPDPPTPGADVPAAGVAGQAMARSARAARWFSARTRAQSSAWVSAWTMRRQPARSCSMVRGAAAVRKAHQRRVSLRHAFHPGKRTPISSIRERSAWAGWGCGAVAGRVDRDDSGSSIGLDSSGRWGSPSL